MCFGRVFDDDMATLEQEGNDALGEIVEMVCSIPGREEIVPLVTHTQRAGIRYLTIDCGKLSMVWKVEMVENSYFKRICLYKRICRPIREGARSSKNFLMPVKIWEGTMCHQIIRLHRLGELRDVWWNYSILPSRAYRDALNKSYRESMTDKGNESAEGSPQNRDSTSGVPSFAPRRESSLGLRLKKTRVTARVRPMMRTMTKIMFARTLTEMASKGRLKVMREIRVRTVGMLRKRALRIAAMLRNMEL
ncbi:unnamed protein product [Tuber aestivum]|uniref:Uncharacterized protein n=1 Tax=Tuber aestivum TaxID=59557 RepID=A0A292PQQ5_9PEZI|nr:unnamed protein product [Tuber aestivum]